MKATAKSATYEIEVGPGECLRIPDELTRQFAEGVWVFSVHAKGSEEDEFVRDYSSLLAGYGPEDEGLYDDALTG